MWTHLTEADVARRQLHPSHVWRRYDDGDCFDEEHAYMECDRCRARSVRCYFANVEEPAKSEARVPCDTLYASAGQRCRGSSQESGSG